MWKNLNVSCIFFLGKYINTTIIFSCSDDKESACNAGHLGLIQGLRWSPGEVNGYPLQFSYLENSMAVTWQATVHGLTKSWTQLRTYHFHFHYMLESLFQIFSIPLIWLTRQIDWTNMVIRMSFPAQFESNIAKYILIFLNLSNHLAMSFSIYTENSSICIRTSHWWNVELIPSSILMSLLNMSWDQMICLNKFTW